MLNRNYLKTAITMYIIYYSVKWANWLILYFIERKIVTRKRVKVEVGKSRINISNTIVLFKYC